MKIKDRIEQLRRVYPLVGPSRFLYAKPADLNKRSRRVQVYLLMKSADDRVSIHKTIFEKGQAMSVAQWADWLYINSISVFENQVIASIDRSYGSSWTVERIVGWHFFTESERARQRRQRRAR